MPITLLDGILLVIMLISAGLAMIRGFVREVLSIASWIAAAAAAFFLYGKVLPYAKMYIDHPLVALGASVAGVFLITLLIVSYITMRFSDFILDSRIGALDRTLGFVFGAARGMLLVVVAMMFFNWFVTPEQQPNWVLQAKSRDLLISVGEKIVSVLPEDPEKEILDRLRAKKAETGNPAGESDDTGYSASERSGIDQLTNSGGN